MEFSQDVSVEFDMECSLNEFSFSLAVRPDYHSRIFKVILTAKTVRIIIFKVKLTLQRGWAKTMKN